MFIVQFNYCSWAERPCTSGRNAHRELFAPWWQVDYHTALYSFYRMLKHLVSTCALLSQELSSLVHPLVTSPCPTLMQGEMVWWIKSNFLDYSMLLRQCNLATFNVDEQNFCCKKVLCNNYWSRNLNRWSLQLLGNKPQKIDFIHQTVSRREVWLGWARD